MKITGKNPKVFFGDKEIENIYSFAINSNHKLELEETVCFEGVYDPIVFEQLKPVLKESSDKIIGRVSALDGEERDMLLKVYYEDKRIFLFPINEDDKEWIKGWMK